MAKRFEPQGTRSGYMQAVFAQLLRDKGKRRLQECRMALILVRPHTSLLDGPVVALYLRKVGIRRAVFAVDPDYSRHPVWSSLLNAYGWLTGGHTMLPLDAAHPYGLRTIDKLLDQGKTVVLFPQGTGIGNPDRPDARGVDWLVERLVPRGEKLYRVMRITREVTLSHQGLFPRVTSYGTVPMGKTLPSIWP
jgi:1-acyl-sn-glycerol-3-phosphate acyltransferase